MKIPAGVDNGDRIRLQGEGEAGPSGAPAGDLYVEVNVREHKIFQRDGDDLYCEVPIRFSQAALGADIVVPTLQGEALIKVPVETQTGKLFRLRGKGVKSVRSHAPWRPDVPGGGRNAGQPHGQAARVAQGFRGDLRRRGGRAAFAAVERLPRWREIVLGPDDFLSCAARAAARLRL